MIKLISYERWWDIYIKDLDSPLLTPFAGELKATIYEGYHSNTDESFITIVSVMDTELNEGYTIDDKLEEYILNKFEEEYSDTIVRTDKQS
jgi:hypothetical protein